jgi:hypothetical protein
MKAYLFDYQETRSGTMLYFRDENRKTWQTIVNPKFPNHDIWNTLVIKIKAGERGYYENLKPDFIRDGFLLKESIPRETISFKEEKKQIKIFKEI